GIQMEVVRKILASGQTEDGGEIARWPHSAWAMQGAVNGAGFLADIFHDVDLAALWPAGRGDIFAEHPERGPHSLPFWDFDSRFEAAVGLREEALSLEAGGGVLTRQAVRSGVGLF